MTPTLSSLKEHHFVSHSVPGSADWEGLNWVLWLWVPHTAEVISRLDQEGSALSLTHVAVVLRASKPREQLTGGPPWLFAMWAPL